MFRRSLIYLLVITLLFGVFSTSSLAENTPTTAIVWVADASGSIQSADKNRYWADAIMLGIDLMPKNAFAAFFAVNDQIVAQTPLFLMGDRSNQDAMKDLVNGVVCNGSTDLSVGLASALALLEDSTANDKHIAIIADISEGGFMFDNGQYTESLENLTKLTEQAEAAKVTVNMFFIETPPKDSAFMPLWEDLAVRTGGSITFLTDARKLPDSTAGLYFSVFPYLNNITTGFHATEHTYLLSIDFPPVVFQHGWIYLSQPIAGFHTRGDETKINITQSSAYTLISVSPPFHETITLNLNASADEIAQVHLLLDCTPSLELSADSFAELDNFADPSAYRQRTEIHVLATVNGLPLFEGSLPDELKVSATITAPDGIITTVLPKNCVDGVFTYDFYPEAFGKYVVNALFSFQGIEIPTTAWIDVAGIELPEPEPKGDYTLWIAVGVGGLIVLIACVLALLIRRRGKKHDSAIFLSEELIDLPGDSFTGKLDIYGIILDGGKTEIPATSFRLGHAAGKKWVRLSAVMELSGIPFHYKATEDIRLMPGSGQTLLVKNYSDATIFCASQPYRKGQQVRLAYGQKMHVVVEEDVNEYEIYYHNAVDVKSSTSRIQMELSK